MVRNRTLSVPVEDDYLSLPPEPQMGNIEYKLKLVNPSATRLQHLVTQVRKVYSEITEYTQGRSTGTHMSESVPPVPGYGKGGGVIPDPVLVFLAHHFSDPGSGGQKGPETQTV